MKREQHRQPDSVTDAELLARLRAAVGRRAALIASGTTNGLRLVHDSADALPGIVIEQFGAVLILQHHEGRAIASLERLRPSIEAIVDDTSAQAVYVKRFVRVRSSASDRIEEAHRDATPWIGDPCDDEITIREYGLSFCIRPFDGFSTGLFLEHRENRRRVHELSRGKSVLNLFSYTCGFSVAAAAGGATEVTSVDISTRFLEWGRRSFAANDLPTDGHRFIRDDALGFLQRARRQERAYDLIVVDPPTFARRRRPKGVFVLAEQLDELLGAAFDRLRPGGAILFATNNRQISHGVIEAATHHAAGPKRVRSLSWLHLPPDFHGDPDYSRALLVRVG